MRRTMKRKVTNTGKDRLYTIFAFFIVAPVISIVLAFALVQNVILPRLEEGQKTISIMEDELGNNAEKDYELDDDLSSTGNEDSTVADSEDITEDNTDLDEENIETVFYGIQIGNFSSLTNAEAFIKELEENNIQNGYIVNVEGAYKVFSGEFKLKEEAYSYLEKVRELYTDAFVNTVTNKAKISKTE